MVSPKKDEDQSTKYFNVQQRGGASESSGIQMCKTIIITISLAVN
jgi:hypothetical protein